MTSSAIVSCSTNPSTLISWSQLVPSSAESIALRQSLDCLSLRHLLLTQQLFNGMLAG